MGVKKSVMSPDQLLECRIQPRDKPILALDTNVFLDAVFARHQSSVILVERVGDLVENNQAMLLETPEAIEEVKQMHWRLKQQMTSVPGSQRIMDSVLGMATLVNFSDNHCEWKDVLGNLGAVDIQLVRLVTEEGAEVLVTRDERLLRVNKTYLQQDRNLGRIIKPSNGLQFLNTLDLIFQLNQGI